jgi:hypothetical protein
MTTPEFKIGEVIENTEAYGTVVVKDLFRSVTNPDWFCYRVELIEGGSYLSNEEDLMPTTPPEND